MNEIQTFINKVFLVLFKPHLFFDRVKSENGVKQSLLYTFPFALFAYAIIGLMTTSFFFFIFGVVIAMPFMLIGAYILHFALVKPFGGNEPSFRTVQIMLYAFTVTWLTIFVSLGLFLFSNPIFVSPLLTLGIVYQMVLTVIGLHKLQNLSYTKSITIVVIMGVIGIVLEILKKL